MKAGLVAFRDAIEGAHCAPFFEWSLNVLKAQGGAASGPGLPQFVALYCAVRCLRSLVPCAVRRSVAAAGRRLLEFSTGKLSKLGLNWPAQMAQQAVCGTEFGWLRTQVRVRRALLLLSDLVAGTLLYPLLMWLVQLVAALAASGGIPVPDLHTLLSLGVLQELVHSWRHAGAATGRLHQ